MRIFDGQLKDEVLLPKGKIVDISIRNHDVYASILCDEEDALMENRVTRRFQVGSSNVAPENSAFVKTLRFTGAEKTPRWQYIWELLDEPVVSEWDKWSEGGMEMVALAVQGLTDIMGVHVESQLHLGGMTVKENEPNPTASEEIIAAEQEEENVSENN